MLLAAVMAMVLAATAPAFAQANAVGGSIQYADCDQIQAAATGQYNTDNQQNAAALAQELGVDENQVLACLGSIAAGRDVNINAASASASATSTATSKAAKMKATSPLRLLVAAVAAVAAAAPLRRLRRLRLLLAARSRARVVHRCWRLALVPCWWPVVFWPAGSFGSN